MSDTSYRTHELTVDGSVMPAFVFEPAGPGPFPAVVVAQHLPVAHAGIEGDPFTLDVGERLAKAGYVAVIPFLFHWWPPEQDRMEKAQAWRDDQSVADLDATFAFTESLESVDGGRIGIVGHCWGGRALSPRTIRRCVDHLVRVHGPPVAMKQSLSRSSTLCDDRRTLAGRTP